MILFIIFFTILLLAVSIIALKPSEIDALKKRGLNLPPGSMGLPFIGDTLAFRKPHACTSLGDYLDGRIQKYGKIYKTNVFGRPTIVSADAELNRFVVMNDERVFVPSFPKAVEAIFGKQSMLVLTGEMHKYMKSLSVNFMGIPRLRQYFLGDAEMFIKQAFSEWKEGVPFSAKDEASKLTFNLIVKNILSMNPGENQTDEIRKQYTKFMKGVVALPVNLPITAHGKAMRARKLILEVIEELMNERISKRNDGSDEIGDADLLGFCLENSNLNAEQFGDLILGLLFGGHETSSTAIAMSVYFLSHCPKAVEQLREEHKEIVRNKKLRGEDAALAWEDYRQMEFTQCVVSETLRLGTIIKFVHRMAKHDVHFKGYDIPEGWCVIPMLSAGHLDPAVYENPHKFDPWRWQVPITARNTTLIDNYMPFSQGLRNCAGLELAKMVMVVFLHHLVLNFDWKLVEDDLPFMNIMPEFPKGLPIIVRRVSPLKL